MLKQDQTQVMDRFGSVSELEETASVKKANELLTQGWVMLGLYQITRAMEYEPSPGQKGQYVRRGVLYVLGKSEQR